MEAVSRSRRIHELWPSWALLGGLVALFAGERVFSGDETMRLVFAGVAALSILAAAGARFKELTSAPPGKRPVATLLFATTAGVALGAALYALIPLAFAGDAGKDARTILWALFPIVLISGAAPLAAMEIATAPAAYIDRYEVRRVRHAFERGLSLALLVSVLFLANYLANRHEEKWDLSYGQRTLAGEQTQHAVRDLGAPVKVTLFFSRANEVAEVLEPYFDSLRHQSSHLTVERVDQALAGQLAKDMGVTENGYITVSQEKVSEKIRIGEKMSSARSALRKLDSSFLTALIKVTRQKKIAYFTTGHQERSASPDSKDTRSPTKLLKQLLETNQYTIKPLGLAEGLADKVPEDATMVFIIGPEKPFSEAELRALGEALDRGVRVFAALEAEREGDPLAGFLGSLGLRFEKTLLANERTNIPFTRTEADRTSIWSNRYSSHESVTTMTRNDKLATAFSKAGHLVKAEKLPERTKVDMVLTAIDDTFADLNGNNTFDKESEKKQAFGLAAAITRTSTTGKKSDESRIFVVADGDVFADELIKFEGNVKLLADIVYWLRAVEEPVVPAVTAEDVQIVHKKEEDALWFYSSTLGVPLLVFGLGVIITRGRRRG